ncbi:MAG: MFS transporter [Vicinamibacteria bacterium]
MTGAPVRPGRGALAIVYLTVFLDLLGFGIILPSLPYYARALGASGAELGVLFAAYSVAQLFGSTLLGRLSDRIGRRPVLLLSLAGSSLSMLLSGLAAGLLALTAARATAGLFGGSIATAQAYVADVTSREERARYMGLIGAAIGVGFVVGPALGAGILALGGGFPAAAFTSAALAAVNLLFALGRLPESLPADARAQAAARPRVTPLRTLSAAWARPGLPPLLGALFCTTLAFVGLETTLAYLTKDRFGLDERRFGLLLVYAGLVLIVVQGGLIGRLTGRFGVRPVAVAGGMLMGACLGGLPLPASPPLFVVLLGLASAGQALSSPTLSTLLSHASAGDEHGALLGAGQSASAAARAIGPLLAGPLYDVHPAAPYLVGGALAILAGLLVRVTPREAL